MTDTHAALVALIATHQPRYRTRTVDEIRTDTGTSPITTCSCGDWTEHPDPTRAGTHTHAHHLADVLLDHGLQIIALTAEHHGLDATLTRPEPDTLDTDTDHTDTGPTPPRYGRCPWCRADVDSVELLEAGPYLTPCWHLVAVVTRDQYDDAGRATGAPRLERATPPG